MPLLKVALILFLISADFCQFKVLNLSLFFFFFFLRATKFIFLRTWLLFNGKNWNLTWADYNIGIPRNVIIHTSRPYPAPGGQSLAFVQITLSQGQSSAWPVITAGFAALGFCGGGFLGGGVGCWLALWETWASNETVEWLRWTQWPPVIKASGRIPFDWVCDALWRGLKPKLTSPFDGAATSCGDVSTRCLWTTLRGFVRRSQTSWCLITSRGVSAGGHYCLDTRWHQILTRAAK